MAYIQPKPLDTLESYGRFIVHRFTRIYPPLWIVMLPLLPVYLIHPELFNNFQHHKEELVHSFLLLPQDYLPLLGPAWTLIHEIYFYIAVSFALTLRFTHRVIYGIAWFILVLLVYCAFGPGHFGGNRCLQLIFSPFSLTFLLGYFIGLWYSWRPASNVLLGLLCGALAMCGFALAFKFPLPMLSYPDNNDLRRFLLYGVPCAFLLLGAVLLENFCRRRFASLLHLGNESYAIYLLHLLILEVIYKGLAATHRHGALLLCGTIFLSFAVCIGAGAVFHRYIELSVTRRSRFLVETWLGLIDPDHPGSA
jgi:peptidoglycan/LPS O-acetylase OafA/YrhL